MSNNNIKSDMGGGNSLNIIRIGGVYEQFNIVLCSDLNGCISNLLVENDHYSSTWHSDYPNNKNRDITQTNIDSRYYCLMSSHKSDTDYDLSTRNHFYQKNIFDNHYGICQLRPIIEFRE